MMRKFVSVLLLSALSAGVMALGLGNIQLNSGLNQPFDARITLLSPTASELDSMSLRLADADAFSRAGIERLFVLTSLKFEVQQADNGDAYIHITSREPLREPFLNFLIEATWSNGKLFREYTVLLDPPLYDPNAGRVSVSTGASQVNDATDTGAPTSASSNTSSASPATFNGSEVGPTGATDTLWAVASRVRPDESVSVNQMMMALLRANPDAFIGNNINGLKQGQILRVPDAAEVNAMSSEFALEEVRSQNALWEQVRTGIAANVTERPATSASASTSASSSSSTASGGESELRLLAPGDQPASQTSSATSAAATTPQTGALANEQLQSLAAENADLRDRLTESEQIIQDLRRLIELKDDEMATLQQNINGVSGAVATEPSASTEPATESAAPIAGVEPQAEEEVVAEPVATEVATTAEPVPGETAAAEEAAPAEVVEAEEEPSESEQAAAESAPMIEVDSAPESDIVGQILGFVFGNIALVGGGLVVIVLLALVPGLIRKRKAAAAEAEQTAAMAFPDFETASAAAEAGDGPQMAVGNEKEEEAPASEPVAEEPLAMPVDVAPATASVGEEDPLAEVNVFLAYEHFDQAEEFVRDAISRQPENLDFHSKLLEVFYSAGDRGKYEEEAKVLHDLTGGAGAHWDMAMIMWQEMSPNRALFSAPAEGEDSVAGTGSAGGIVDLTADDEAGDDSALDFDLGMAMADSAPAAKSSGSDDMLDITAGSEDVLDVTATESSQADEDILDVTAAVGLEPAPAEEESFALVLPAADEQDILDISSSGSDDPLDVTAHSDIEGDQDENLLDISMSGSTTGGEAISDSASTADDNLLDFDVAGMDIPEPEPAAAVGNEDGGLELDFETGTSAEEQDLGLSLDMDSTDSDDNSGLELSLDTDNTDSEGGLELDFGSISETEQTDDVSLDIGLGDELETPAASGIDIDMDSTVKMPKGAELSLDEMLLEEDDDDDENHTVFVPRTNDAGEQSADDENATKLDLAKAYVELGDKSNAISILEEVIADGNPAQRRQAEELMSQI